MKTKNAKQNKNKILWVGNDIKNKLEIQKITNIKNTKQVNRVRTKTMSLT